jgi:hypothetical protein
MEDMVELREDEVPDAEDCDDSSIRVGMDKGAGFGYANLYRAGGKLGRTYVFNVMLYRILVKSGGGGGELSPSLGKPIIAN